MLAANNNNNNELREIGLGLHVNGHAGSWIELVMLLGLKCMLDEILVRGL